MKINTKQRNALKSEPEYWEALARTIKIFNVNEDTTEAEELNSLLIFIKDYEDKHIHIPLF